ncbi:MAG: capsule assembly Wzi family protein [Pseudomonadota bacterium]
MLRVALVLPASLAAAVARAAPEDDPAALLAGQAARSGAVDRFLGDGEWGGAALAWRWRALSGAEELAPWMEARLAPELRAIDAPERLVLALDPAVGAAFGRLPPVNQGGDVEAGLLSLRAGAQGRALWRGFEAVLAPEVGLDLDAGGAAAGFLHGTAWGAWRGERLLVGFGMRDRWLGPGRQGSLLLSDHARPAPLGTVAGNAHLPGKLAVLGRWRLETSWGWLQRPREDVQHPGLMLWDARWLPVPWIELGATRMALFGGEGRPPTPFWQLIVPLDPHVEGDPDLSEPDQDEIASLDARLCLPLGRWLGGPVRYVEGWWQYGAEDVIARKLLGVSVPSLAGVANLWGAEAAAGRWVLTYEGARVFDDYFRWYTGHRVYHDGFTQDGLVLGDAIGGDAMSTWVRLGFYPLPWGAELRWEQVRRVGVVESLGENLLALASDEVVLGGEARCWYLLRGGGRWYAAYGLQHVDGLDFVPGAETWRHRLAVGWVPGPFARSTGARLAR